MSMTPIMTLTEPSPKKMAPVVMLMMKLTQKLYTVALGAPLMAIDFA
eukprot:CAMPEP_0168326038 /NCGR_PEP_ID=MMETSP0213-20121227/5053_1 /TAXON_ID=151035 /ORGANISM="Euplotes harpa, Strain FSP1.4" /LENGTH=46 /DNA_ID= /DNA_START= /DNA_END= /DNA_ORIENTATION=